MKALTLALELQGSLWADDVVVGGRVTCLVGSQLLFFFLFANELLFAESHSTSNETT